jgi:hypothetical protein
MGCATLVAGLKGITVTIVRIGASKKYSDNWEAAFGRKGAAKAAGGSRGKRVTAKKPSKKSAKARKR